MTRPNTPTPPPENTPPSRFQSRKDRILPRVPDYQLVRRIGSGGYGDVWMAKNTSDHLYAIKIVYRGDFHDSRPFLREFEGIQKFEPISRSHDSQVAILHVGRNETQGYFYYVMELADDASGQPVLDPATYIPHTLQTDRKKRGRLNTSEVISLGIDLSEALHHLHRNGLIHRDVKPANIVYIQGKPRLADIGLVTESETAVSFVGTEGFIPPEGPGGMQSDIYGLGKVLYELATGLDRQSFPKMPSQIASWPDQKIFLELNEIILKACERNPAHRYASVRDLANDLRYLESGKSILKRNQWNRTFKWRVGMMGTLVFLTILSFPLKKVYQRIRTEQAQANLERDLQFLSEFLVHRQTGYLESSIQLLQSAHQLQIEHPNLQATNLAGLVLSLFLSQDSIPETRPELLPSNAQKICFSKDGATLVYTLDQAQVYSLKPQESLPPTRLPLESPLNSSPYPYALSPNGSLLALQTTGALQIFSLSSLETIGTIPTPPSQTGSMTGRQLAFHPHQNLLIRTDPAVLQVISITSQDTSSLSIPIPPLNSQPNVSSETIPPLPEFSADGSILALIFLNQPQVKLWNLAEKKWLPEPPPLPGRILAATWAAPENILIVACDDRVVYQADLTDLDGAFHATHTLPFSPAQMVFDEATQSLVLLNSSGALFRLNQPPGEMAPPPFQSNLPPGREVLALNPGRILLLDSKGSWIQSWKREARLPGIKLTPNLHPEKINASPHGTWIVAKEKESLSLYHAGQTNTIKQPLLLSPTIQTHPLYPDGHVLLISDNSAKLLPMRRMPELEPSAWQLGPDFPLPLPIPIEHWALAAKSPQLVFLHHGQLQLVNTMNWEISPPLLSLPPLLELALSPDGGLVAWTSGDFPNEIYLQALPTLQTPSGQPTETPPIRFQAPSPSHLRFDPSGIWFAFRSTENLHLYHLANQTMKEAPIPKKSTSTESILEILPGENLLLYAAYNQPTFHFLRLTDLQTVAQAQVPQAIPLKQFLYRQGTATAWCLLQNGDLLHWDFQEIHQTLRDLGLQGLDWQPLTPSVTVKMDPIPRALELTHFSNPTYSRLSNPDQDLTQGLNSLEDELTVRHIAFRLRKAGHPLEALQLYQKGIEKHPEATWLHLGLALLSKGDHSAKNLPLAEQSFETALRLEPHLLELHYHYALFLAQNARYEEALEVWIRHPPLSDLVSKLEIQVDAYWAPSGFFLESICHSRLNRPESAKTAYQHGVETWSMVKSILLSRRIDWVFYESREMLDLARHSVDPSFSYYPNPYSPLKTEASGNSLK